jgi:membrane-bound lytic murein transglycosylase D
MWQFMLSRGKEYGLVRTRTTDDRLDPEKATRAAARHLRDLYTQFGDWYLAVAAYNCGPVNVERAVARSGYADLWELRRRSLLPRETANYVPIILAMVIMAKNPAHYGLQDVQPEPSLEYATVVLEAQTHLELIADVTELPVSEIRALNPALLTGVAPAGYALHVPEGTGAEVTSALSLIPAPQRTLWRLHRFAEGDTLGQVAGRYRTTVKQIAAVNPNAVEEAGPGSLLIVPAPAKKPVAKRTATKTPAAKKASAAKTAAVPRKAAAAPSKTAVARKASSSGPRAAVQSSKPKPAGSKSALVASKKTPAKQPAPAAR